jgi:hypothetical protein
MRGCLIPHHDRLHGPVQKKAEHKGRHDVWQNEKENAGLDLIAGRSIRVPNMLG